MIRDRNLKRR